LFRGQPEIEEETGEFDDDGNPKIKRRKADDEHLIRQALLQSHLIDAVISLPLNVFYGAGVPACLLILRRNRPASRIDKVLLVYAARHYRELSNQNELRPQDVMRMLVHYHAYGDAKKVQKLVQQHGGRIRAEIERREQEEVERLEAEYARYADKVAKLDEEIAAAKSKCKAEAGKTAKKELEAAISKLEKQREKPAAKLAERDERIAEAHRKAEPGLFIPWVSTLEIVNESEFSVLASRAMNNPGEDDRKDVAAVGDELIALYDDADELLKHARVVSQAEIEENEFNLNIPRYVDTFEPEPRVEVKDAQKALKDAEAAIQKATDTLQQLLRGAGYAD
jgi:type I restriction enzyme M protein